MFTCSVRTTRVKFHVNVSLAQLFNITDGARVYAFRLIPTTVSKSDLSLRGIGKTQFRFIRSAQTIDLAVMKTVGWQEK